MRLRVGIWPEKSFLWFTSIKFAEIVTVLHATRFIGYFAVVFYNAYACARKTDGDSLTFLINIIALTIFTLEVCAASDVVQNASLLLVSLIFTFTSFSRYRFWKNRSACILRLMSRSLLRAVKFLRSLGPSLRISAHPSSAHSRLTHHCFFSGRYHHVPN